MILGCRLLPQTHSSHLLLRIRWLALWCCLLLSISSCLAAPGTVTLLRTPNGGIQPQATVDSKGVLHLIYYKGDPKNGDLFYVRQQPGIDTFSEPIRVNSQLGSAIAMGTIRGGQIAIGKNDRVHVAWNGSGQAEPKGPKGGPMLYTRLNDEGTAFEPQRNLMLWTSHLDGGGTVAADRAGNVYVAWHANDGATEGEINRAVYLARSGDAGKTFERERKINPRPTGVCACCAMRAFIDNKSHLYIVYRAATEEVERDTILLLSRDGGNKFEDANIHKWRIGACPMSSASFTQSDAGVEGAWETKGQVYFAAVTPGTLQTSRPVAAPGGDEKRKHPVIVANSKGETLFAWTAGTGWQRGGSLGWQVYDKEGKPTAEKGQRDGVPVWGLLSAYAKPDGSFVLLY